MSNEPRTSAEYQCRQPEVSHRREHGVRWVIALTFAMMTVEIVVGYRGHSMALLADGWHMATHVAALGITALAYSFARRFATHRAFTFGTGKVHALGGFASALLLGVVALSMVVESTARLLEPRSIDFDQSLPVAVIGLVVNLLSVALLHHHDEHHDESDSHDHGHRAAFLHVLADAVTSALAITALLIGRQWHVTWLDPATGIVGALVILKWSYDLTRLTASELLDVTTGHDLEERIRCLLAEYGDAAVIDLHVWPMGHGRMSGIVTIESDSNRSVEEYRARILERTMLAHLTVELRNRSR